MASASEATSTHRCRHYMRGEITLSGNSGQHSQVCYGGHHWGKKAIHEGQRKWQHAIDIISSQFPKMQEDKMAAAVCMRISSESPLSEVKIQTVGTSKGNKMPIVPKACTKKERTQLYYVHHRILTSIGMCQPHP